MLVPRVEVGPEGTRGTAQFRPLRVTLLQQVNPPIEESNFVMTHPHVVITEPLTSNIHAKGVISDRPPGNRGDRGDNFWDNRSNSQDRVSRPINRGNQGYQGQRGDNQDRRQGWRTSSADSQTRQPLQDLNQNSQRRQRNSGSTAGDRPSFEPADRGPSGQENRRPQNPRFPFQGSGRC